MYNKTKCNNCENIFFDYEFELLKDGQEFIKVCPYCETDSFLIDLED